MKLNQPQMKALKDIELGHLMFGGIGDNNMPTMIILMEKGLISCNQLKGCNLNAVVGVAKVTKYKLTEKGKEILK